MVYTWYIPYLIRVPDDCFSTFNLARGAILKCISLYFGVACLAAFAPAAAGSGGGVASAAPLAGPAVFLVVL